jgi:hypothetical protein
MEQAVWKRRGIKHVFSISEQLMNSPRRTSQREVGIKRNEREVLQEIKSVYPGVVTDAEYEEKIQGESKKAEEKEIEEDKKEEEGKVETEKKPDGNWLKKDIIEYLSTRDVEATMRETKKELLEKVENV